MVKAVNYKFLRLFCGVADIFRALERFLQAWIKKLAGVAERLHSFFFGLLNQQRLCGQEQEL